MTGDGTQSNPYTVASVADFTELNGKCGYVVMTADIDFNSIGAQKSFDGIKIGGEMHFDGQGHTINNFYQEITDAHPYGGLFQGVFYGSIKNVKVLNAYVLNASKTNTHYAAILAAYIKSSVFENVEVSGVVSSLSNSSYISGFAAIVPTPAEDEQTYTISFRGCKATVNIIRGGYAGGYIASHKGGDGCVTRFEDCVGAFRFFRQYYSTCGYVYAGLVGKVTFNRCICQIKSVENNDVYGLIFSGGIAENTASNCAILVDVENVKSFYGFDCLSMVVQSYIKGVAYGTYKFIGADCNCLQSYIAVTAAGFTDIKCFSSSSYALLSFYDSNLMPNSATTYGAATTEQLKSAEWLREQGWAI